MSDETKDDQTVAEEAQRDVVDTAEELAADTKTQEVSEPIVVNVPDRDALLNEGQKFVTAFGEVGALWFVEGKTYDEAMQLHVTQLENENEQLRQKLSAAVHVVGDKDGVEFQPEESEKPTGFVGKIRLPGK